MARLPSGGTFGRHGTSPASSPALVSRLACDRSPESAWPPERRQRTRRAHSEQSAARPGSRGESIHRSAQFSFLAEAHLARRPPRVSGHFLPHHPSLRQASRKHLLAARHPAGRPIRPARVRTVLVDKKIEKTHPIGGAQIDTRSSRLIPDLEERWVSAHKRVVHTQVRACLHRGTDHSAPPLRHRPARRQR
jgi:hypothetical protein